LKVFHIYRPSSLGDFCLILPIIYKLKSDNKNCKIIYISEKHSSNFAVQPADLSKITPYIDEFRTYRPSDSLCAKLKFFSSIKNLNKNAENILVYLTYKKPPHKILLDLFFFKAIFNSGTVGFKRAFLDSVVECFFVKCRSEFYRLARQVYPFVKIEEYALPQIMPKKSVRVIDEKYKNFVVFPFGKLQCNRWPLDNYAKLISKLVENGHKVTVIGGVHDVESLNYLGGRLSNKVSIECGLDFLELSNILDTVHFYIGSDSGPMHLAALHGVRCCAIFSDRDRRTDWRPFGSRHEIIKSNMSCGGCMLQTCYADPSECLEIITVDDVYSRITGMLLDEFKI
jgi:ADP-heptose:LPS heptosyltransferase